MDTSGEGSRDILTSTTHPPVRPFRIEVSEEDLVDLRRRIADTQWPEKETVADQSQGVQLADNAGTRALLGHRLRLAQGRGETERATAVHHRDRRARHSFHSRSFEPRERVAAHRQPRLAGLGHRAAEDHRSTYQSHGTWR